MADYIIYLDIAFTLRAFAEEIEDLSQTLESDDAVEVCKHVEWKCSDLSDALWWPLHLVHGFYFVRLVLEFPFIAFSRLAPAIQFLCFSSLRYLF